MDVEIRKLKNKYLITHNKEVRVVYSMLELSRLLDKIFNEVYVYTRKPKDYVSIELIKEMKF